MALLTIICELVNAPIYKYLAYYDEWDGATDATNLYGTGNTEEEAIKELKDKSWGNLPLRVMDKFNTAMENWYKPHSQDVDYDCFDEWLDSNTEVVKP